MSSAGLSQRFRRLLRSALWRKPAAGRVPSTIQSVGSSGSRPCVTVRLQCPLPECGRIGITQQYGDAWQPLVASRRGRVRTRSEGRGDGMRTGGLLVDAAPRASSSGAASSRPARGIKCIDLIGQTDLDVDGVLSHCTVSRERFGGVLSRGLGCLLSHLGRPPSLSMPLTRMKIRHVTGSDSILRPCFLAIARSTTAAKRISTQGSLCGPRVLEETHREPPSCVSRS